MLEPFTEKLLRLSITKESYSGWGMHYCITESILRIVSYALTELCCIVKNGYSTLQA